MALHILEKIQIAAGFGPVNLATGANTGDWINMKNYDRCAVVFIGGLGVAAQDPTITLLQAQSDGGSSKALNFTRVDRKQATALTTVGTFTTITQADGNTYTNDTSGELFNMFVIDISVDDMDVANGYDWLQANIADTGSTSKLGVLFYILHDPKYNSNGVLPSAIA
jgi:hypothetical protein